MFAHVTVMIANHEVWLNLWSNSNLFFLCSGADYDALLAHWRWKVAYVATKIGSDSFEIPPDGSSMDENQSDVISNLYFYVILYSNKHINTAKCRHDNCEVCQGSVLYAPPELPAEHLVFLSYLFMQGVTISNTQLTSIKLNQINGNKIVTKSENRGLTRACVRRVKLEKRGSSYSLGWLLGRHMGVLAWLRLLHDIELNPGPNVNCQNEMLTAVTQNCRGLGSIDKTRMLLNKMYNLARKTTVIAMLQETMITTDRYLELAWRGGFVHTPGTGNSQGCVTLISTNDEISEVKHYGNRGHCFTLSQATGDNIKVCNVYAPNGFDETKANFFNEVLDDLETWEGNIILAGDFNITLSPSERFCRGVTMTTETG